MDALMKDEWIDPEQYACCLLAETRRADVTMESFLSSLINLIFSTVLNQWS